MSTSMIPALAASAIMAVLRPELLVASAKPGSEAKITEPDLKQLQQKAQHFEDSDT